MRKILLTFFLVMITICLLSCDRQPSEKDIQVAMTHIAKTPTPRPATKTPTLAPTLTLAPSATTEPASTPDTTSANLHVSWKDASFHYGENATICGPVVGTYFSSSSKGQPTFLNLGKDFPAEDRFVVVIWADNRDNFSDDLENYYFGETICVTGKVEEYQGIYQIEAKTSSDIEVE